MTSPVLADSFGERIAHCDELFAADEIKQANRICMTAFSKAETRKEYIQTYSRLAVINRRAGNNKTALDLANAILEASPDNTWAQQFVSEDSSITESHSMLDVVMIKNKKRSSEDGSTIFDVYDVYDKYEVVDEPDTSTAEIDTAAAEKKKSQEEADKAAGTAIAVGIGLLALYGLSKVVEKTFEPVERSPDYNSSSGSGSLWMCKAKCEGKFGDAVSNVDTKVEAGDVNGAVYQATKEFKPQCASYDFEPGSAFSANVGTVFCSQQ